MPTFIWAISLSPRTLKVAKRLCCVGILNTGGVFIATGHDPAPVAAGSLWFTLQGEFGHVGFLGSATEGGVRGCEGGMCGELAKGHRADTGARNARRVSRGIRPDHQRATRYELRPAAAAARRPSRDEGWGEGERLSPCQRQDGRCATVRGGARRPFHAVFSYARVPRACSATAGAG